jgi:hypothetical protein
VIIDGAGSWKRGLAWEGRLRNSMGTVEIHDQARTSRPVTCVTFTL